MCSKGKLVDLYPHLIVQWHPTKNEGIDLQVIAGKSNRKVWWICSECGHEWLAKIANRTALNSGCPICVKARQREILDAARLLVKHRPGPPIRITTDEFIARSREVHGDKYDYSNTVYCGSGRKVEILCIRHGLFSQNPGSHLRGCGCNACYLDSATKFLEKAHNKHGQKYNYSLVKYSDAFTQVTIICPIHGSFLQTPTNHVQYGCAECGRIQSSETRRLSQEEFLHRAMSVHQDTYGYSKSIYVTAHTPVIVTCYKHGDFLISPNKHTLGKQGCNKCGIDRAANAVRLTNLEFITRAIEIHKDKYNYSLVDYHSISDYVNIICSVHGIFKQRAYSHLNGQGCIECSPTKKQDQQTFLYRAMAIHGSKYSYAKSIYIDINTKIIVTCPKHGDFQITPHSHLNRKSGCAICKESFGERIVRQYLDQHEFSYAQQWKFNSDDVRRMRFDFVVWHEDSLYVIEFQGKQHYVPVSFSSDNSEDVKIRNLYTIATRDKKKRLYCANQGYTFLAIPFWQIDGIDELLCDLFSGKKLSLHQPPDEIKKYVVLVEKYVGA